MLFGDFCQFWSGCLDDAATGSLPTLSTPTDVLIQPRLPWLKGARALVVVAPEDWQVLLTVKP